MSSRSSFQAAAANVMGSISSSSSISSLATVADPPVKQMDGAAMDYFLIEMVNTLRASSAVAVARAKQAEKDMIEAGLIPPLASGAPPVKEGQRDSVGSNASRSLAGKSVADEEDEAVRTRLEAIGMHVGANITELLCHDRPLFSDTLDAVKFVCKDLWAACWDKQVDNLRTNHRGIYVLQDQKFKPIARMSSWEGRAEALKKAKLYLAMPAGILRGTLIRLGYQAVVVPEVQVLPQCSFQLRLPKTP